MTLNNIQHLTITTSLVACDLKQLNVVGALNSSKITDRPAVKCQLIC